MSIVGESRNKPYVLPNYTIYASGNDVVMGYNNNVWQTLNKPEVSVYNDIYAHDVLKYNVGLTANLYNSDNGSHTYLDVLSDTPTIRSISQSQTTRSIGYAAGQTASAALGSQSNPYPVTTIAEWNTLAVGTNWVKVMNNIDFAGSESLFGRSGWTGGCYGNGKVITNALFAVSNQGLYKNCAGLKTYDLDVRIASNLSLNNTLGNGVFFGFSINSSPVTMEFHRCNYQGIIKVHSTSLFATPTTIVTNLTATWDNCSFKLDFWRYAANAAPNFLFSTTATNSFIRTSIYDTDSNGNNPVVGANNVARERRVTVGVRQGDRVQIVSGVQEGDQVVVSGGLGLEDKAKVAIQQPKVEEEEEPSDEDKGDEKGKDDKGKTDKAKSQDKKQ